MMGKTPLIVASEIFHLISANLRKFAQKDGSDDGDLESVNLKAKRMWNLCLVDHGSVGVMFNRPMISSGVFESIPPVHGATQA
jgi:hypothetical protein